MIGFDEGKGVLGVIKRGERYALRVKHADAPTRLQFAGLEYWPADPGWKITGKFVPHPPGKTMPIVDIIGITTDAPNPGAVEFVRDGKTYRIEAMGEPDSADLFLVLADRTSGHGSYAAGRFMDTPGPDAQGRVVLDFNRAYNPPCAFTPFATCPLPPPENRLDLAISAGEKAYTHTAAAPMTRTCMRFIALSLIQAAAAVAAGGIRLRGQRRFAEADAFAHRPCRCCGRCPMRTIRFTCWARSTC